MVSFGDNIYLWRMFRGLSQEELAEQTGIPRPNISAIESGKREVSMATLRLLASGLGTNPGALVDGIGPIHYKGPILSRRSLEKIAQAAVGRKLVHLTSAQKTISCILSGIIKNKINACNAVYKNTLKGSQTYVGNWLALKAAIGREASNDLLARVYNYIWLGEKQ